MKTLTPSYYRHPSGPRCAPKHAQRGAIGLVGVVTILMAFLFATLSIDAGRLWMEQHNLQKAADMAALASARYTGCGNSNSATAMNAATNSMAANGASGATLAFTRGQVTTAANQLATFIAVADPTDITNGTQVVLNKTVPASLLMGGLFNNQVTLTAKAIALGGPPRATFTLGAAMLTVDNALTQGLNSVLSKVFGKNTNVNASVFQKLGASSISLQDLMTAGGFATVDDLLNSSMTISDLLQLYEQAAQQNPSNASAALAMSQLLAAVGTGGTTLTLKDVLSMNPGNKDALISGQLNLLNLVSTSVSIAGAQKSHLLDFNVAVNAAGTGINLQVGDIPPIAFGPGGQTSNGAWCTSTSSTDTKLTLYVSPTEGTILGPLLNVIKFLTLGLVRFDLDLAVQLKFGNASAYLNYLEPNNGNAKAHFGTNTSAVSVAYTNRADALSGTQTPGPGKIIITVLGIQTGVTIGTFPNNLPKATNVDFNSIPTPIHDPGNLPQSTHGSSELAGSISAILTSAPPDVRLVFGPLKINVTQIVGIITNGISQLIAPLLSSTIDPILRALGINIGSADITLYDMQIVEPQLVY